MRKCFLLCMIFISYKVFAQENYEIQVYASPTMEKGYTMIELHSNYTFNGTKVIENNVLPTNHVLHETIEVTHGFTRNFEIGFYLFNAIGSDQRTNFVGTHIRPRIKIPDEWNWPVGVSLSIEAGYQKFSYSTDDWSMEIRPIVDKTFGHLYISFNPTFDKSFHGLSSSLGFIFSPNFKSSIELNKIWAFGIEYYGSVGNFFHFDPYQEQQHALFAAADVNFSPIWELNFGYGFGITRATDSNIIKVILGYKFGSGKKLNK
jgi:hypothetical protein